MVSFCSQGRQLIYYLLGLLAKPSAAGTSKTVRERAHARTRTESSPYPRPPQVMLDPCEGTIPHTGPEVRHYRAPFGQGERHSPRWLPATRFAITSKLSPRRVRKLGFATRRLLAVGISRDGRTLLVERSAFPSDHGVVETIPFSGGRATRIASGDQAAWNG